MNNNPDLDHSYTQFDSQVELNPDLGDEGRGDLAQIDQDHFNHLMKVGVFVANASIKVIYDKKKVQLDQTSSRRYFNGTALGQYLMIVLKLAETYKQKLDIESGIIEKLKNQSNP